MGGGGVCEGRYGGGGGLQEERFVEGWGRAVTCPRGQGLVNHRLP